MLHAKTLVRDDIEIEHRVIEYVAQVILSWNGSDDGPILLTELEQLNITITVFDQIGVEMGDYEIEQAPPPEQRLINSYVDESLSQRIADLYPSDMTWGMEEH